MSKPIITSETIVETTAVKNEISFKHFGINSATAMLYGYEEKDIQNVQFSVSKDQIKPKPNTNDMAADYWGWFDYSNNRFSLIYPKYFLLDMCFPAGIEGTEKANQGKAYSLELIK